MPKCIMAAVVAAFCLLLFPCEHIAAGPMQYPVDSVYLTSAFGPRIHPITGQYKTHSGVDLAGDYGDPVRAAAGGVVSYSGWISGYGNTIVVEHGNNVSTLYGHNQTLLAGEGQRVYQGQQIAEMGSTGNSTGPHCHFEVRVSDVPVDPGPYISGLEALEVSEFGILDGGSSTIVDFDDTNITLEISADFAKPMRDLIEKIVELCTKGLAAVKDDVYYIFVMLMTVDLALSAMYKGLGASPDSTPLINWLVYKLVFYGFATFLITHWGDFIGNLAIYGFPALGSMAAGSSMEETGAILSDPTKIVQKGMQIIAPVINETLKVHGWLEIFTIQPTMVICLILGVVLFFCFLLIGVQLMVAYLQFYFTVLFSYFSFMFAGLKQLRKYASGGINAVIVSSLNLMFFCLFSIMVQNTMINIEADNLIETKNVETAIGEADEIKSLDDAMIRIKSVESGGDYTVYNYEGSGAYGAYQQMPEYWDGRCQNYVDAGGMLDLAEFDNPDNAPDTYYSWCPENQDKVSRYMLEGYYADYGSWDEAVRCWVGGPGMRHSRDADIYLAKCLDAKGGVTVSRMANLGMLLQLLLICLMFIYFGDKMSKLITRQFGGMGFRLTSEG